MADGKRIRHWVTIAQVFGGPSEQQMGLPLTNEHQRCPATGRRCRCSNQGDLRGAWVSIPASRREEILEEMREDERLMQSDSAENIALARKHAYNRLIKLRGRRFNVFACKELRDKD